jgi:hypothetical protein
VTSSLRWFAPLLHRVLLCLSAAGVAALLVVWPLAGFHDTWLRWLGWPSWQMGLGLAGFLGVATWCPERWRWLGKPLAAASLCWLFATHRVLTMGDGHWWRKASREGTVTWAEPLSSHLQAVLYRVFGPEALELLPIACGFAATWIWLGITDRLIAAHPGSAPRQRWLAAALWASAGALCGFFYRYVEHSQIGVPLLLLGLATLSRWSHAVLAGRDSGPADERDFRRGTRWLLLAALLHLQYSGMFVAAVGAAWLVGWRHGAGRSLQRLAAVLGWVVAGALGCWLLFCFGPFTSFVGSVGGGADARLLTPFVDAEGSWTGPGALFGADHLALTASLLLVAVPLALPFFAAVLVPASLARTHTELVASSAAFAWLLFVSLYGFDLGWPTDADLMLSMSVALAWLTAGWWLPAVAAARPLAQGAAGLGSCLAVLATWSVLAPLVRPTAANVSQANTALADLRLEGPDGLVAAEGPGPFRVVAALGTTFTVRARGPAGREFWILRGAPQPAVEGHPYGGVADIVVQLEPQYFVHAGQFADDGSATATMTVAPLPDGGLPGIQMVVFLLPGTQRSTTSAAYYFVAP